MPAPPGQIEVSVVIAAPMGQVWEAVADLGSHGRWMSDIASITVEPGPRWGLGTRLRVDTRLGPLRTTDLIEVTGWEEGKSIEVSHGGLVSGTGRFELTPMAGGTRFSWKERLSFPWWLGGPLAAAVARPVLARTWRRNLTRLSELVELSDP